MTSISANIPRLPMPPSPRARIDSRIAAATAAGSISQTDETALEAAVTSIGQSLRGPNTVASATTGTADAAATASGTARTSFKDKLDGLIDAQVKGGTLTDAQATELKGFFAQGAPPKDGPRAVAGDSADAASPADGTTATAAAGQTAAAAGPHHAHHHGGGGGGGGGGAIAAIMAALDGSDSTDGSTDTSAIDALTGTTSTGTTASTAATGAAAASPGATPGATSIAATTTQQLDKLIGFLEKMRESIGSAQTYGAASASNSGTDAAGMVFSGIA